MAKWNFLKFVKRNYQIIYSLVLIVIIPLALFLHTYMVVKDMQGNMDVELQSKALLIENIIETALVDEMDPDLLQAKIDKIIEKNPEIAELKIAVPEGDRFKIVVANDRDIIGEELNTTQNLLAWHEGEAFAHLVMENSARFWEVTKSIVGPKGDKQGLIMVRLSLADIDFLTRKTIRQAYVFLIITVAVILLLIINNAKLFQQATLYYNLREIDRMKDDFISMVSHELRAPVTNIRLYLASIVKDERRSMDNLTRKDLNMVISSSTLLSDLVDDILEVTRIEQRKIKLNLEPVNLTSAIKEIAGEFKAKAEEKNIEIIYEEKGALADVLADPKRLKQILVNLVDNAVKYTLQGKITITSVFDASEKKVKVRIADTGLGMNVKKKQGLFQKFYRIKTSQTDGISGTGLGLWITKNLVEMMGGEIYVESIEGTGSVFTVLLPLADKEKE